MFLQEGDIKPVFNFHYLFHMYSYSNALVSSRLKIPLIHSLSVFFFSHAHIYFKFSSFFMVSSAKQAMANYFPFLLFLYSYWKSEAFNYLKLMSSLGTFVAEQWLLLAIQCLLACYSHWATSQGRHVFLPTWSFHREETVANGNPAGIPSFILKRLMAKS